MGRRAAVGTKQGEEWQGKGEQGSSEPWRRRAGGLILRMHGGRRRWGILASVVQEQPAGATQSQGDERPRGCAEGWERFGRGSCSGPSKENTAQAALMQPRLSVRASPAISAPSPSSFLETSPFPRPLPIIARR